MRWYLPDDHPLLWDELRRRLRDSQSYLAALIYLTVFSGILLGVTYLVHPGSDPKEWPAFGHKLWLIVMVGQLAITLLISPALTATAIIGDCERGSFEALLLTPISTRNLVVGKLLGCTVLLWLLVLTGVPVMSIIVFIYGGVSPSEMILGYLLVLTASAFCAAQGLLVSSRSTTTSMALLKAYLRVFVALLIIAAFSFFCVGLGIPLMCFDIWRSINLTTIRLHKLRNPVDPAEIFANTYPMEPRG